MKKGIHPEYYPNAKVICGCGNTFTVGSTKKVIRTDVCSACHPFFTGEQRIVDTGGQVERFMKRMERTAEQKDQAEARLMEKAKKKAAKRKPKARQVASEKPSAKKGA